MFKGLFTSIICATVNFETFDPQTYTERIFDYNIHTILPNGQIITKDKRSVIEEERAGGFFGYARILEDENAIVKGTQPRSRVRKFTRIANWRFHEFPSQVNEQAAQMDFLTSKLLHLVLPTLSEGRFYSPDAVGYTKLNDGYAQVLEKVKGRGPIYLEGMADYEKFKAVQKEMRELEYRQGFEHGAQIDEENPLGLPNLWRDDKNSRWIHMDTLPAFQHVPTFGIFKFPFHQKARDHFYPDSDTVTFNKLHTDAFIAEIKAQGNKFEPQKLKKIIDYAELYKTIRTEFELTYHPKLQVKEALKQFTLGSAEIGADIIKGTAAKAVDSVWGIINPYRQQEQIFEGMEKAKAEGLITEEEFAKSEYEIKEGLLKKGIISRAKALGLYVTYGAVGTATHIPELYLYAEIAKNTDLDLLSLVTSAAATFGTFMGARIAGGILRFPATHLLGAATRQDLSTAAKISLWPIVGDNIALIAQIHADNKGDKLLTHYAIRNMLADLSTVLPTTVRKPLPLGGWGTDAEAETIKNWYAKIEGLIESTAPLQKIDNLHTLKRAQSYTA